MSEDLVCSWDLNLIKEPAHRATIEEVMQEMTHLIPQDYFIPSNHDKAGDGMRKNAAGAIIPVFERVDRKGISNSQKVSKHVAVLKVFLKFIEFSDGGQNGRFKALSQHHFDLLMARAIMGMLFKKHPSSTPTRLCYQVLWAGSVSHLASESFFSASVGVKRLSPTPNK